MTPSDLPEPRFQVLDPGTRPTASLEPQDDPTRSLMNIIITIVVIAALTVGAIALGVKFFNTSVEEQEDQKGWKD